MIKAGTILKQATMLVLAGVLLGALFNALRPEHGIPWRYPWSQRVQARALAEGFSVWSLAETRVATEQGTHWLLDARAATEFHAGTIPGALSLPLQQVEETFADVQFMVMADEALITFCSGEACDDGLLLALFLREQGYTQIAIFPGGMEEWIAAGYDVEGGW